MEQKEEIELPKLQIGEILKRMGLTYRQAGELIGKDGVEVEYDIKAALQWCDIANLLRIQLERQDIKFLPSLREYALFYGVNTDLLNQLDKKIVIMHPGPINRGVEITSEVADSEHSIILQQVENGVAVRMAVLYLLASVSK